MSDESVTYSKEFLLMMQNAALNKFIVSSIPDEKSATITKSLFKACNRHGVTTETMLKIIADMAEEGALNDD